MRRIQALAKQLAPCPAGADNDTLVDHRNVLRTAICLHCTDWWLFQRTLVMQLAAAAAGAKTKVRCENHSDSHHRLIAFLCYVSACADPTYLSSSPFFLLSSAPVHVDRPHCLPWRSGAYCSVDRKHTEFGAIMRCCKYFPSESVAHRQDRQSLSRVYDAERLPRCCDGHGAHCDTSFNARVFSHCLDHCTARCLTPVMRAWLAAWALLRLYVTLRLTMQRSKVTR